MTVACGDSADPSTTMDATGETGDGDGDGDATGDGDGDATGDGDGDPATGDGDGDPTTTGGVDTDMDGVDDGEDNCPEVANPNQLDYDGNGMGNVCDVQTFTMAAGMMNTTAEAGALAQSCQIPLMIEVIGGEVRIQLTDDADVAAFEIVELEVADIPEQLCNLGPIQATVSLSDFLISNGAGDFPVSMPHTLEQHDGGQIAGDTDLPHPVVATAILSAAIGEDAPMDSDLLLEDGAFPTFTANITGGGAMGVLSWADPQFEVATSVFEVEIAGNPVNIDFELRGLTGSVTLTP